MRKNKKLFAILTLVAFMMTLMPVMAFAADVTGVAFAGAITLKADGAATIATTNATDKVYASDVDGVVADTSKTVTASGSTATLAVDNVKDWGYIVAAGNGTTVNNDDKVTGNTPVAISADTKAASVVLAMAYGDDAAKAAKHAAYNAASDAVKALVDVADASIKQPATNAAVDPATSVFGAVYVNGGNPNINDVVQANVLFTDAARNDLDGAKTELTIWAEEVSNPGTPSSALNEVTAKTGENTNAVAAGATANTYAITDATNDTAISLKFARSGEYNVYATLDLADGGTAAENIKNTTKLSQGNIKVSVSDTSKDPKQTYTFDVQAPGVGKDGANSTTLDYKNFTSPGSITVKANNVAETKVTVDLKNDGNRLVGKTVNISTNSANITTNKTTVKTDAYGQFDFKISGTREGNYKVYLSVDGVEVVLNVTVGNTAASYINLKTQPTAPIALYSTFGSDNKAVVFTMTDINGNVVAKDETELANDSGSGAYNMAKNTLSAQVNKYISFTQKPTGTTLKDADLDIDYNDVKQNYYLTCNKPFDKEGSYEIKMVLDNGNFVTIAFEVKEFQTPVKLILDYDQESIELGGTSNEPELKYVDANGTTQNALRKVKLAATGYAISNFNTADNGIIVVKNDEKYIGQTITVTAIDSRYNLVATTALLVADEAQAIEFANATTVVNANNKIDFQIVDSKGNKVSLGQKAKSISANFVILEQPEGAKVSAVLSGGTSDLITSGKGTMALTSNVKGNVTVQALVTVESINEDKNTGLDTKYYTGTQTFAVGSEVGNKVQVVMSIGSHEMIKNGSVSTIDAAPMIQDNRTFVPFRAISEAFGATVEFDAATNVVTAKLDGKTVALTIGSTVMTVGEEVKTLDVAPFISTDRTMVPVRAIAEAFGFSVVATSNPDGTTADVVFTK